MNPEVHDKTLPTLLDRKYVVVAASDMPSIAVKLAIRKAFGVYPADEDFHFIVRDWLPDKTHYWVFDVEAMMSLDVRDPFLPSDDEIIRKWVTSGKP